jgi:hypothetical protein
MRSVVRFALMFALLAVSACVVTPYGGGGYGYQNHGGGGWSNQGGGHGYYDGDRDYGRPVWRG